ncbi:MarR family transcriptional regulator [Candidatus Micrarchaeota archaeon]|nr:MarR family transcriptional regulator [Candidatus Micrarchaeota archaeon]MBU1930976.1 MarR family transcriptional regulator [Candidatus Micrarchaeota archaeon]
MVCVTRVGSCPLSEEIGLNIGELALLKVLHERISPNTFSMEHYARTFSAFLVLEKASVQDLCRLTDLDAQSIQYLVKNLLEADIIHPHNGEFTINLSSQKLLELVEEYECISSKKSVSQSRRNSRSRTTPTTNHYRHRRSPAMACTSAIC